MQWHLQLIIFACLIMPKRKLTGTETRCVKTLLADPSLSLTSIYRTLDLLDKKISRHKIAQVYHAEVLQLLTTMELPHRTESDRMVTIEYLDPARLLMYLVEKCPRLQEWYAVAANKHRGIWSVAVTFDEYVPGDKLKCNNFKKGMTVGHNFLELGREHFYCLSSWLIAMWVRSSTIAMCQGGFSAVLRLFLRKLFLSPNGLGTAGIPLKLHGQWFLLRARLTNLCSDGDGLRSGLCLRGANGLRPCPFHSNVTRKDSNLVGNGIVDIGCHRPAEMKAVTDSIFDEDLALVTAAWRRWQANELTKVMYTNISQSRG